MFKSSSKKQDGQDAQTPSGSASRVSMRKEELAAKIRQVIESDNTKNAILEADRSVLHRQIIEVVDIARGEGIEGIAFAKGAEH